MLTLNRIMTLLNVQGKQQKDLAEELGIKKNNITDWKSGKSKSYTKYLPQIAAFFGVSIDYLTGGVGSLDSALFKHIDFLCKNKGISFVEALEQAGFTNEEIDQYYAGNRGVIFTRQKELAETLNDNANDWGAMAFESNCRTRFLKQDNSVQEDAVFLDDKKIHLLPLYETVSAGFGVQARDQVVDYMPCYISNASEARESLCIKVTGDSMFPKIENGDIIQVQKQTSVDSGSIAVVLLDGEEGLVKKVVYGDDWIELHSINPMYQTQRFEGQEVLRIQVVGLVRKVIKDI